MPFTLHHLSGGGSIHGCLDVDLRDDMRSVANGHWSHARSV